MDKLFHEVFTKKPSFLFWILDYVKSWRHESIYNEKSGSGGVGVLRYMGPASTQLHCCFITEVLFTAAQKFNLTLEYVPIKINGNSLKDPSVVKSLSDALLEVYNFYLIIGI